jgi:hypothetical protein
MLASLGHGSGNGPLLLVGPAAAGFLCLIAAHRGALKERTTLANCVLTLTVLLLLSGLNPVQGSLAVGAGGLLFLFISVLWFWVGRSLVSDERMDAAGRLPGNVET